MIWLPIVEDLHPRQTEWVMVDESQDLNRCGLELVLRACAQGGRLLFVGDRRQAIYGFVPRPSTRSSRRHTSQPCCAWQSWPHSSTRSPV